MGSWWDASAVNAFLDKVPADTVVCLDETYCEFAPDDAVPDLDMTRKAAQKAADRMGRRLPPPGRQGKMIFS